MANATSQVFRSKVDQFRDLEAGIPPESDAGIFGATLDPKESELVLIGVPWDATTSYGGGTSGGPSALLPASHQLDLEDLAFGQPFKKGITLLPLDEEILDLSRTTREKVLLFRDSLESNSKREELLREINRASGVVNKKVETLASEWLSKGKKVAVVGGDHSSPFGLMSALSKVHKEFGILHVDAHFDLRMEFEGFHHSHASIMHNVMTKIPNIAHLAQLGIRDFSREERLFHESMGQRASVTYSRDMGRKRSMGTTWAQLVQEFLRPLPEKVYISFDIDGLDPSLCPSTGTPVPGGLQYEETMYLLEALVASGRKVVGFDLCEVTPHPTSEWDANVGARVLYKLCGTILSET
jgi:agmatinase